MIYQSRLTTTGSTPAIYYSTVDGTQSGTPEVNAITCIAICNTGTPDLTDETVNSVDVNIWLNSVSDSTKLVSELTVPAGETVFLSEERLVLGEGQSVWAQASTANLITITLSVLRV